MDDWTYCKETLPKVSRTFALNISVLQGELHKSILIAYLFCRTIDTIEDAADLDPQVKIRLLLDFPRLIKDPEVREKELDAWIEASAVVDGSPNDLDLLMQTRRVFNVFNTLKKSHQEQIIPSVSEMARGMAFFQRRFHFGELIPLENEDELEEYCYFVAGVVGEMLCNLFLAELPNLPEKARDTMKSTAVSFGLGLQMTNISKDLAQDRKRGWSYIPKSFLAEEDLTVEDFHSEKSMEKNLRAVDRLLNKTMGHLGDALRFILSIPKSNMSLRLFCIWPLWMAMETVAVLHRNEALLHSDANVKISRAKVKRILWTTPLYAWSNFLLKRSFESILKTRDLTPAPAFNVEKLHHRLKNIPLETASPQTPLV
jgi:farnesyl-diphosphate farnesyltransferase